MTGPSQRNNIVILQRGSLLMPLGLRNKLFLLLVSIMALPVFVSFVEGQYLLSRSPDQKDGLSFPLNILLIVLVSIFDKKSFLVLLKPTCAVLFIIFVSSILWAPLRITSIYFSIFYLYFLVGRLDLISDKSLLLRCKAWIFQVLILCAILLILSSFYLDRGFLIIQNVYVYNFLQYWSVVFILFAFGSLDVRGTWRWVIMLIGLAGWLVVLTDSKLGAALIFVGSALLMAMNSFKFDKLRMMKLFSFCCLPFYLSWLFLIADGDRYVHFVRFFDLTELFAVFLPILDSKILNYYSFHNEYLELYRAFGLFFIAFYIWIVRHFSPSIDGLVILLTVFFCGLVVNLATHLYFIPFLALFMVISKWKLQHGLR